MRSRLAALLGTLLLGSAIGAQDSAPEILELEITLGKRPPGAPPNPYLIKFSPKAAMELDGKAVPAATLRERLAKSLKYVLEQQQRDGSWIYDAGRQIRPDVSREHRQFQGVALQTCSPTVMTALCCMGLRAHEELAPDRIREAVRGGLEYVIENAPKHPRRDYSVWTWSFAVTFMADEFARAKDGGLKDRIRASIQGTVERILQEQHAGMPEPPKLPALGDGSKDPKPSWSEKIRESMGGLIGVSPVMEQDTAGGVLVQQVQPGGPADKAGLKAGDRIFEVDGHQIGGVAHLMDVIDSMEPGKPAKIKVRRGAARAAEAGRKASEDGGWSYYPWAESMTFTTATTVLALLDAKSIGVDVPQGELDRAVRLVQAAQYRHANMSEDGFVYRLHANKGSGIDIRAAIGRVAVCMNALHKSGKADDKDLEGAIETFIRRRGELDRVRGYPGNHVIRSYTNAAYYFLYGHYNTALAVNSLKDAALKKKQGAFIQEAILSTQWKEGTWTDHQAWGELYGTAMALMGLGQLKFVTPDAYKTPILKLQVK